MAVEVHHDASPFRPDWECLALQHSSAQQHLQSVRHHLCRLVPATLVYNVWCMITTALLLTYGMLHLHLQELLVHMLLYVNACETHLHICYIKVNTSSVVKRQ